ncbi:acetyl-CoA hydrolase/transferase family protein [Chloroflexota bacterium]
MNWEDEYKSKLVSPEEAASKVKSGDWVVFPTGRAPYAFGLALASRKEELKDVKVLDMSPSYDFGWYDPGWEESFLIHSALPTAVTQQMFDDKRCEVPIWGMNICQEFDSQAIIEKPDVVAVQISSPDKRGFSSFGASLWNKKGTVRRAKLAIGEVNPRLIRTYGDNFIHVSEFDYLVEHEFTGGEPGRMASLAGREIREPEPYIKTITGHVSELIRDGDTLQMGVSRSVEPLIHMGLLDGKHDIGWFSEATVPGVIPLVREGVINGRRKTIHPGICVTTALGGDSRDEMEWASENPLFWVVDSGYIWDIRVIGAHDNYVAINAAAMIDLGGQITAERVGYRLLGGAGGQIPFVLGAWLSRGGRAIHVLPSTVQTGGETRSRIVVDFPPGSWVTQHRYAVQFVVTEYGIADLRMKTMRQRAQELVSVAHPDFRAELRKEAERLY